MLTIGKSFTVVVIALLVTAVALLHNALDVITQVITSPFTNVVNV